MHLSERDRTGDYRSLFRFPDVMERSHWHMHLELVFCFNGRVGYELGIETLTLERGDLLLFWAALPHRVTHSCDASSVYVVNTPAEDLMSWSLPRTFVTHLVTGRALVLRPGQRFGAEAFSSWHDDLNSGDYSQERLAQKEISCLVERLAREFSANRPAAPQAARAPRISRSQELLSKVIGYISAHCDAQLTVAGLSQALDYHPGYLSTRFRELSGVSLHAYIRHIKVSKARALLASSARNMEDIAWEAGFGSVRQFYEAIKSETGMTPHQIRKSADAI